MDERKKVMKMLFFGYLTVFVMLLFLIYLVAFRKNESFKPFMQQISVEGSATITVSPDVADVSFDLSTKEKTASAAKEANDAMLSRLNEVLKKYDIKEKELKMNYIYIRPYYDFNNGKNELTGYTAQKMITVKIKNIELYNAFIDDLLKIGISNINSVEFSLEDVKTAKNQAREKALQAAKEKAELYAKASGKTVLDVIEISENEASMRYNGVSNYRGGMAKMSLNSMDASLESGKEERGSISVNASIFVVFAMK